MQTFNIKPKVAGKTVRDPITYEPLKTDGEEKPCSEYWLRRVLDGAVVKVKNEVKTETKKIAKEQ
tara:strand:+ start:27885 stop:28079 length:195 start_codon:yes stop_codon:yes gene_type:complete